ncbi:hypothetical protein CYMTET_23796 [Cymbomonas tetramitiformis]|uniref:Small RNA 2'-O-methyltransferase n=1 Tax=Cymbomonas tetramitiformis TaxID=36881 RepID=A0AAE0FXT2_9CHLO|nr:hypothetical protein CYMTET_23796 [Cymbomonas tetramitiformis]
MRMMCYMAGATKVLELGFPTERIVRGGLQIGVEAPWVVDLVGVDVSKGALQKCSAALHHRQALVEAEGKTFPRTAVLQGSLDTVGRDPRAHGSDAVVMVEVVEHLDPQPLEALGEVVLRCLRPPLFIVSTPNKDYNLVLHTLLGGLLENGLREADHRFEWTQSEFQLLHGNFATSGLGIQQLVRP